MTLTIDLIGPRTRKPGQVRELRRVFGGETVEQILRAGAKKGKNASSGDAPFSTSALSFTLAGKLRANVSSARIIDFDFEGPAVVSGGKEAKGKDRHGSEVSGKKDPGGGQSRSMAINATGKAMLKANFVY